MFSRTGGFALRSARYLRPTKSISPRAYFSQTLIRGADADPNVVDPDMNGGYINPPKIKRQYRDPYGDWWDKQERRNYGEPVHEDNDLLGLFTPYEYTHMSPGMGLVMWGGFITCILGITGAVYTFFPGRPAVPREFEDGLERELGGPHALRARKEGDPL